jgi:hypothetical protein
MTKSKYKTTPIITIRNISKPETNGVLARIVIALRAAGLEPVIDSSNVLDNYIKAHKGVAGPIPGFMEKVLVEINNG